jgi:hypothetical protein
MSIRGWKKCDKVKVKIGALMKEKISMKREKVKAREEQINTIMKCASLNIKEWFDTIRRRIAFNEKMKNDISNMESSLEENDQEKIVNVKYQSEIKVTVEEKMKKTEEVLHQFENDNLFFFDKKCWELLKNQNVTIIVKGSNLLNRKYKEVKTLIRRGIKLRYSDMLKVKKIIQCTLVDSIDQGRVNREYFRLLKEMNMFSRFVKIENWMLGRSWSSDIIKKVMHKHFSSYNFFKQRRTKFRNPMAVCIQNNINFEIVSKTSYSSISKAIKYLKWNRNKFKIKVAEVKSEDVFNLNLDKISYGITNKWKRYAEINVMKEALLFESFVKRKKRKRIETIFNCLET